MNIQGMVSLMLQSAELLTRKWDENIEAEGSKLAEISVGEDLRSFSADVISRACFGSSYFKGKKIFSKLRTLQKIISNQSVLFGSPALGYIHSLPLVHIICLLRFSLILNEFMFFLKR